MEGTIKSMRLCALAGAATGLALAAPAHAQSDTRPADTGIAEIVVTAQKREQSLQAVPVAITALTADALEQNQITNVRNIDSLAPNLQIKILGGASAAPAITMRGALGIGTASGADKGISIYLDGVYLGSAAGQLFDMANIERIEVLRGPQGTLFGRNSSAGAISIVTRDPSGELGVSQKLSYGNYDQFRSQTRIDTPQFGPFSAQFTYMHLQRRGDIRNLGAGTVWDFTRVGGRKERSPDYLGGRNTDAFTAALKAEFSPDFKLVYKYDNSDVKMTTPGNGLIALDFPVGFGPFLGAALQTLYENTPNRTVISARRPKAVNNWFTVPTYIKNSGHNLTLTWQLSDDLSFKNVAAYRKADLDTPGSNFDGMGGLVATPAVLGVLYGAVPEPTRTALINAGTGAPFLAVAALIGTRIRQASDEFQFNYNSKALTLTAGGIYYWQSSKVGGFGTAAASIAVSPVPNFIIPNSNALRSNVRTVSYAGFAQAEVHVTSQIDLIGGIRFTRDKKRGTDRAVPTIPRPYTYSDTRPTFLVGVNYQIDDAKLLYAKYGTGYISGGQLGFVYQPETSKSWEAGIKADWLDRNLRTNLALFHVKYGNLQTANSGRAYVATRPELAAAGQVLANTGDATAYGFELETTAKPVQALTLTANVGYTHFKFTSLVPEVIAVGVTAPVYRPKWTGNFSAQYETQPIFDEAYLQLRFAGKFTGDQLLTSTAVPFRKQFYVDAAHTGNSWLFDASATLTNLSMAGSNAKVGLWVRNLLDSKRLTDAADVVGILSSKYEEARTFGVDLSFDF